MRVLKKEQERLNRLTAHFLRLNEAGKAYITSITRQLTSLCTPDSRPSTAEDVSHCGIFSEEYMAESDITNTH
jgi:hypothetical protein